jgi:sugar O-acyltransferase (sialic acid O-acetyltransferase NeuD family)
VLHELPVSVQRIVIVGAGGFGREVLHWARDAWPDHAAKIAGFLSADPDRLDGHASCLPILGDPSAFEPLPSDGLLLAIGIPGARRRVAELLLAKGARFLTLIHPTAIVVPSASVAEGAIVCPFAIVSDAVRIGRFALVNYHSSLGHDASAGDFSVLSPYATLGGGAAIEEEVFLGMHATVGPGKRIGSQSKVSANSAALSDAPAGSLVHGVPGRISPLLVNSA